MFARDETRSVAAATVNAHARLVVRMKGAVRRNARACTCSRRGARSRQTDADLNRIRSAQSSPSNFQLRTASTDYKYRSRSPLMNNRETGNGNEERASHVINYERVKAASFRSIHKSTCKFTLLLFRFSIKTKRPHYLSESTRMHAPQLKKRADFNRFSDPRNNE